jgi:hypothetical protein
VRTGCFGLVRIRTSSTTSAFEWNERIGYMAARVTPRTLRQEEGREWNPLLHRDFATSYFVGLKRASSGTARRNADAGFASIGVELNASAPDDGSVLNPKSL